MDRTTMKMIEMFSKTTQEFDANIDVLSWQNDLGSNLVKKKEAAEFLNTV